MQVDPKFRKKIEYLDQASISESPDVIYIVDDKLVLRAFNDAWVEFALNNAGTSVMQKYPLGTSIQQTFPDTIQEYLTSAFARAMESNIPFELDYECSSANQFRLYHQSAYPIADAAGLVISNHMIKSKPHTQPAHEFSEAFLDDHGLMIQCSNCRKICDPKNRNRWLWVPDVLDKVYPNTSHAICPRCYDFYYPESD